MKDEPLKNYLLAEIAKMKAKMTGIANQNPKDVAVASDIAERVWVLNQLEQVIKDYDSAGYVVTDGNKLYFQEWDDVHAVVAIDDQPGVLMAVKHFNSLNEAHKVADALGWQVRKVSNDEIL